ncbi:MAG: BrnT family toxin [Candidatus Rokuibacteriota bacterium]
MAGFEWDDAKAKENLSKHGVSFEEASTVFGDPLYLEFEDIAHSHDEQRLNAIGRSVRGRIVVVAYVERGDRTRIISAWPAAPRERDDYDNQ